MTGQLDTSRAGAGADNVSLGEAFRTWLKIGLLSFGGPAGQIALMHRVLVDEKRWIGEARFLHALNYCMLLPGPEAQQLAVYVGWLLHRTLGGLIAGILFILPGALVMLALAILYVEFAELSFVRAAFIGIKAAVLAIVVEAVLRIGGRTLKNRFLQAVAAGAFVALFFFDLPFPLVVIAAGLIGVVYRFLRPARFAPVPDDPEAAVAEGKAAAGGRPSARSTVRLTLICLALWFGPIVVLASALGGASVFVQQSIFFSKMAVVSFGGAYAVLSYVAQEAVTSQGWLAPSEMLDGLGLAETTPGPLIMVVQFVGFLAAYRNPGALDPLLAGCLGALLTTWVTFVPCFLWIFLGAPYVEALRGNRALNAALSTITAAVVGVILNLAIWFALHVVFDEVQRSDLFPLALWVPDWKTLDLPALGLAAAAMLAMLRFKLGMIPVLLACAAVSTIGFYALPGPG